VTQQLWESAAAWGEGPRFLIRDNDDKFAATSRGAGARPDPLLAAPRPGRVPAARPARH